MFTPLQTLPGWPEAPIPTVFQELLLLLIIPVVVGIVVALLVYAPTLAGKHKPSSAELLRRERAEKALEAESDTARIES